MHFSFFGLIIYLFYFGLWNAIAWTPNIKFLRLIETRFPYRFGYYTLVNIGAVTLNPYFFIVYFFVRDKTVLKFSSKYDYKELYQNRCYTRCGNSMKWKLCYTFFFFLVFFNKLFIMRSSQVTSTLATEKRKKKTKDMKDNLLFVYDISIELVYYSFTQ